MADRYDDRYRGEEYRRERGYGRDDRGFIDRAGDELRSWFGDEEAERRRRMDEARYGRDWDRYGRDWDYGHRMGFDYGRSPRERGWSGERWGVGERSTASMDYWRPGWPAYWNEPGYGERFRYGLTGYDTRYGQGSFAGRGPRGYQRTDERLREDVCERLTQDPWVDASEIEVTVRGGEVTLSGSVRDRSDKREVEDVAERVSGVREVHNNLRVTSGWEGPATREPREQGTATTTAAGASTSRR